VAARKLERLLNLLIMLKAARRPLTVEEIRAAHQDYNQPDDEAFRRQFERDKDELRELGVPLETRFTDAWETEQGYLIPARDYELPELDLTPDEAAALGLAARLWQPSDLAEASAAAIRKLQAAGIETQPVELPVVEPRVSASDPAYEDVYEATRSRRPIRFSHRPADGGPVQERVLDPWRVVHRRGRWYVVGHDRERDAVRSFRLSRIVGPVTAAGPDGTATSAPEGFDALAAVAGFEREPRDVPAVVRVRRDTCWELRREATSTAAAGDDDRLTIAVGDIDRAAEWLAGFGADVVVESPPELRAAVVALLQQSAEPA
jgi:proteasome accessory factor B